MSHDCHQCGMSLGPAAYHPYPACLLFGLVKSGDRVEIYLHQIMDWGRQLERLGLPNTATIRDMNVAEKRQEQDR